ncbi:MAG: hypothetical protein NXI30_05935 [bacterium]|nr:hypothetical protein [bacterium]
MAEFADDSQTDSGDADRRSAPLSLDPPSSRPGSEEARTEQIERLRTRVDELLNDLTFEDPDAAADELRALTVEHRDLEALAEALALAAHWLPRGEAVERRDEAFRRARQAPTTAEAARIAGVARGDVAGGRPPKDSCAVIEFYLSQMGELQRLTDRRRRRLTPREAIESTTREFGFASTDACIAYLKVHRPKAGEPGFFSLPARTSGT